jgi:hypothetical protein
MSVVKFNLNQSLYNEINEFLIEYQKKPRVLTNSQMESLHVLATKATGERSVPSGCGSCNSRALDKLFGYIQQYENPE